MEEKAFVVTQSCHASPRAVHEHFHLVFTLRDHRRPPCPEIRLRPERVKSGTRHEHQISGSPAIAKVHKGLGQTWPAPSTWHSVGVRIR